MDLSCQIKNWGWSLEKSLYFYSTICSTRFSWLYFSHSFIYSILCSPFERLKAINILLPGCSEKQTCLASTAELIWLQGLPLYQLQSNPNMDMSHSLHYLSVISFSRGSFSCLTARLLSGNHSHRRWRSTEKVHLLLCIQWFSWWLLK